jgi:undecaprenyl diphosphate synthase
MRLFIMVLEREVTQMRANGIRLRVVGDVSAFEPALRKLIEQSQDRTASNHKMTLTICANYGGRWDVLQATRAMLDARPELAGAGTAITEASKSASAAFKRSRFSGSATIAKSTSRLNSAAP